MFGPYRGNVTAANVVLPLQGCSELELKLLLMLAGVHQLLVTSLQLGLQVFYLRRKEAPQ